MIVFSRLTSNALTSIRKALHLVLTKSPPLNLAYLQSIEKSLAKEWLSAEDSAAYDDM